MKTKVNMDYNHTSRSNWGICDSSCPYKQYKGECVNHPIDNIDSDVTCIKYKKTLNCIRWAGTKAVVPVPCKDCIKYQDLSNQIKAVKTQLKTIPKRMKHLDDMEIKLKLKILKLKEKQNKCAGNQFYHMSDNATISKEKAEEIAFTKPILTHECGYCRHLHTVTDNPLLIGGTHLFTCIKCNGHWVGSGSSCISNNVSTRTDECRQNNYKEE